MEWDRCWRASPGSVSGHNREISWSRLRAAVPRRPDQGQQREPPLLGRTSADRTVRPIQEHPTEQREPVQEQPPESVTESARAGRVSSDVRL